MYITPARLYVLTFFTIITLSGMSPWDAGVPEIVDASTLTETFDSIGGALTAKRQLKELVQQIKNPRHVQRMGGKPIHGILLSGKPGNGKTLLARALAKEADCSFIAVSASYFASPWIGIPTQRVKTLFETARQNAPCIIFIDEIDSLGAQRDMGHYDAASKHHADTVNELIAQIDGFNKTDEYICVVGATNRLHILDEALVRSGRLDKHIVVPAPDYTARLEILKIHTKKTHLSSDVNLEQLAQATANLSGADLASMVDEAISHALRHNRQEICFADLDYARDTLVLGQEQPEINPTKTQAWQTAIHEAGHTLVGCLHPDSNQKLYKVTITARGNTLGSTHFLPVENEEYPSLTHQQLLARVALALGGSIAEEIVFKQKTTGVSDDFQRAYAIAREMVCTYGMSSLGAAARCNPQQASDNMKAAIDTECKKIITQAYNQAYKILHNNHALLLNVAHALVKKQTLTAKDVEQIRKTTKRGFFALTKRLFFF